MLYSVSSDGKQSITEAGAGGGGGVKIVALSMSSREQTQKKSSLRFSYNCRFSLFLKDPLFQIIYNYKNSFLPAGCAYEGHPIMDYVLWKGL